MDKIKTEVTDFETKNKNIIASLNNIERQMDPTYKKYAAVCREYETLKVDLEKAINWLRECRRRPRACYSLDFQDLNWIYRRQTSA